VIRAEASGDISVKDAEAANRHVAWATERGSPFAPTPLALDAYLYVPSDKGVLAVYELSTGRRVYQERVATGFFSASPVAAAGKVYITSEDGEIYVVPAGPKFELLETNSMDEVCLATPAISGDMLIVRTRSHLYGIAADAPSAKAKASGSN